MKKDILHLVMIFQCIKFHFRIGQKIPFLQGIGGGDPNKGRANQTVIYFSPGSESKVSGVLLSSGYYHSGKPLALRNRAGEKTSIRTEAGVLNLDTPRADDSCHFTRYPKVIKSAITFYSIYAKQIL